MRDNAFVSFKANQAFLVSSFIPNYESSVIVWIKFNRYCRMPGYFVMFQRTVHFLMQNNIFHPVSIPLHG